MRNYYKIIREIDELGTNSDNKLFDLKPWDIKFIADLIDRDITDFTEPMKKQIDRIYEECL
jgi:hypothetical protein|tara:strand:+ start:120 stop:302 length:183 start_codon:yes stop_codon:yes gene_type:complete